MPIGTFVGVLPPLFFVVLHLAGFAAGAFFAFRAFGASGVLTPALSQGERGRSSSLGWAFTLFALAELLYLSYHLDLTVLLFAHTLAELLLLTAVVLVYRATRASV